MFFRESLSSVVDKKILTWDVLFYIQTGLRVSISVPVTHSITLLEIMRPEDTVANYYLLKLFSLFSVFSISFLPCFFFLSDFYFCKLIVKSVKTEKKKKGVWAGRKWQRWSRLTSLRVCLGSVASNRENFTALSSNPESVPILFQLHPTNLLPLQSCTCCLLLLLHAQVQL